MKYDFIIIMLYVGFIFAMAFVGLQFYDNYVDSELCREKGFDYSHFRRDEVRNEVYLHCCADEPGEDVCKWVKE